MLARPSRSASVSRPDLQVVEDEAAPGAGGGDLDDARLRFGVQGLHAGGGNVIVVEQFGQPRGRAGTFGDDDEAPLVLDAGADEVHHLRDVALVAARFAGVDRQGVDVQDGLIVRVEGRDGPPGDVVGQGRGAGVRQGTEARSFQVRAEAGGKINRRRTAVGRCGPRGGEEFLVGGFKVVGAGADLLRFDDHGDRARRELRHQRHHFIHQHRGQGFHAFDGDAAGDLLEHVRCGGHLALQFRGPAHHVRGDQEFAARRGVELLGVDHVLAGEGALVGDGEPAHRVHLVAEEVDADGVVVGGREDIQDAAAHGELAAVGDHVHPGVGGVGERLDDGVERAFITHRQGDRLQVAQAFDQGLHDGADRCDDDLHRIVLRVGEPAQDGEPAADGVRAR